LNLSAKSSPKKFSVNLGNLRQKNSSRSETQIPERFYLGPSSKSPILKSTIQKNLRTFLRYMALPHSEKTGSPNPTVNIRAIWYCHILKKHSTYKMLVVLSINQKDYVTTCRVKHSRAILPAIHI
jgi:hypothetical protein